jgi:HAD superfamily hydrolase (TIGR01509 family)
VLVPSLSLTCYSRLVPPSLDLSPVLLLCLDAGNTVIFLDHSRLSGLLAAHDFASSPEALVVAEGEAKRLAETDGMLDVPWAYRDRPGAPAWGRMVGTIAQRAGFDEARVPSLLEAAWRDHERVNLWSRVPEALPSALDALRDSGVRVALVSNSEGMLDRLFVELGIRERFDLLLDSGIVGVEKPDPRIFRLALDRFDLPPSSALHVGDVYATDILGARAAGIPHALLDPFGHYEGVHADVPRVPSAAHVAQEITRLRSS